MTTTIPSTPGPRGPMAGVRVLDLSNIIAGPLAACLLGDFGADVVKVELPGVGDAMRHAPPFKDGVPLWWKVTNRNKRCVTIDLHKPEGQDLVRRLVPQFDVVVENFRPGVLERWGLGWEDLHRAHPRLIMLRVTAYGQTGPYASRAGFARMAEAFAGLAYITGTPDTPPLHAGYPIADALCGVFGAMAVGFALWERDHGAGEGQWIDLSLYEAILRTIEYLVIEHDQLGAVRERGGNLSQYVAPSNVYRTRDGHWVSLTTSTQTIWERFVRAIDRADLLDDPRTRRPEDRLGVRAMLDALVQRMGGHPHARRGEHHPRTGGRRLCPREQYPRVVPRPPHRCAREHCHRAGRRTRNGPNAGGHAPFLPKSRKRAMGRTSTWRAQCRGLRGDAGVDTCRTR